MGGYKKIVMQKKSTKIFALFGALIGWFAIITQFYLMMINRGTSVPETIFRFFAFFTITTNILVALCFTYIFLGSNYRIGKFFSKASTVTAITVYIIIVGIVYNVILRFTWNPPGLQKLVDELLHSVIPVISVIFWVVLVPASQLKWKNAFPWLIYPIFYMAYVIILGAITTHYPYLFIDVNRLGYNKALMNAALVLLALFLLSLVLIGTGKIMKNIDRDEKKQ
jgi:hypothetical protein